MTRSGQVTLGDVEAAATRIEGVARRTPVIAGETRGRARLKCENLQRTGAFKFRGIYNEVASIPRPERADGIVIVSAGNAGIGAALAARLHDIPCTVVMPAGAVRAKVEGVRALGARALLAAGGVEDLFRVANELVASEGCRSVHPFDAPAVIAGQGTIALEIFQQFPAIERLVVPTAGGGMLAGCAVAVRALRPDVHLVGVEVRGAAKLARSIQDGVVVPRTEVDTVADGLAYGGYGQVTFEIVRSRVDEVVSVTDDQILDAMGVLWREYRIVAEPSGAAALAATRHFCSMESDSTVAVVSGGNVDLGLLAHAVAGRTAEEWRTQGRRASMSKEGGDV